MRILGVKSVDIRRQADRGGLVRCSGGQSCFWLAEHSQKADLQDQPVGAWKSRRASGRRPGSLLNAWPSVLQQDEIWP